MSPAPISMGVDPDARTALRELRLVALAETLGVLPRSAEGHAEHRVDDALGAFARAGVGRWSAALHARPDHRAQAVDDMLSAIEESPMPGHEWVMLTDLLGDDLVAELVGVSPSSVRRYGHGERPTPDDVAGRLHVLALIVSDLAGSYNDFGIRRWFRRSRSALGGDSPSAVLSGGWSPESERVREVRALARALSGSPAT